MNIAILGAGAMGTALALQFDQAGNSVVVCSTKYDEPFLEALAKDRTHPSLGHHVPDSISITDPEDWAEALSQAEIVVIAVASTGVRSVVTSANPDLKAGAIWAVASKGWDAETAEPTSSMLEKQSPGHPVVTLVGPSLAAELAGGTPTGLVCASSDVGSAMKVAQAIGASPTVQAFVTHDVHGVEVGAALKNVLAIAIGMCDGISEAKGKPMSNTKAALFSRGLVEMARLAKAMGGEEGTVLGLAGAGDLFVTVLGGRNGRFGRLVGSGVEPLKALDEMGTTVEGYDNTREAVLLADRHGLDLPIVRMVHSVLYDRVDPEKAVEQLVSGPVEREM